MSAYYEIAYAAAANRLCFFTGTGFSKAVTGNSAPGWQGLLEQICELFNDPDSYKEALFPENGTNALNLEEVAQVLEIELQKLGKNLHAEVAELIEGISLDGDYKEIAKFMANRSFRVVTTNYDKLVEELAGEDDCHSLAPGLPIPRSQARVKVFHVHGSIEVPNKMVVTSDDYFKFLHGESYFSRKLSTILHENTVVVLGYSFGDTNLKSILSDYRGFSKNHIIGSNLFLVSRSPVSQHIKDYYSHCFGIRVLDSLEVEKFFGTLNEAIPEAESRAKRALKNIRAVALNGGSFKSDHLRIESSFFEILSSIGAIGLSINDQRVVDMLGRIISDKTELTGQHNAWDQYEHLARWLVHLGSILEIKGTSIEELYLKSVLRSMQTMRRELYIGYSWHAYKAWSGGWSSLIAINRLMIKQYIETNTSWPDALAVVNR